MMNTHRTVPAIFATVLGYCSYRGVFDDVRNVDTRSAGVEAPAGTIGLARPHPPLPPAQSG
jgi:hypothetical protein